MNNKQNKAHIKNLAQRKIFLCFTLLMLVFIGNGDCQQKHSDFPDRPFLIVINRTENSLAYKYLNMVYREVFRRMDIPMTMIYLPLKRGAAQVVSGKFDGETTRIRAYEDSHPTLIRVKESLYSVNVSAFALNFFTEELNGWDSLKGSDYKVEYPRGVLLSEINLKKVIKPQNLSNISTPQQGLKKLFRHRTSVYIDDELVVFPLLKKLDATYHGAIEKVGVMESVPLYMYIHKKNHLLEPRLSKIIKEIKDEGLITEYRKIVFDF